MKKTIISLAVAAFIVLLIITCPNARDYNASARYNKIGDYFILSTCSSYYGMGEFKKPRVEYIGILGHVFDIRDANEKKAYPGINSWNRGH
jgi:hypothetical protein